MTDSIQPDNRSALQVAIEQALDQMIEEVDAKAPLPQLFDGMNSPPQFLPSLAIERGVIDMSPNDGVEANRETISASLSFLSHSCTPFGIDSSINALGYKATTSLLRPYVFKTVIDAVDMPVDEASLSRIQRRISSYKASRDSVDVVMSRSAIATVFIGIVSHIGEELTVYPYQPGPIVVSGREVYGAAVHTIDITSISSEAGDYHFNKWSAAVETSCALGFTEVTNGVH